MCFAKPGANGPKARQRCRYREGLKVGESIFSKSLSEVTVDDIRALVDARIKESETLDYKQEFHADEAAKLICAMANKHGGLIIYGVVCDPTTNEPVGFNPLQDAKLDDRVDSICIDRIRPIVSCESRYVETHDGGRLFIVKVPESDLDHAVDNRDFYVKQLGQKRPYTRADREELEELRDRRKKSEERRELLIQDYTEYKKEIAPPPEEKEYAITCRVYARYPRKALIPYYEIRDYVTSKFVEFTEWHSTAIELRNAQHVDEGVCAYVNLAKEQRTIRYYFAFSAYGLVEITYYVQWDGEPKGYIRPDSIATMLLLGTDLGLFLLQGVDFRGTIVGDYLLSGIRGTKIWPKVYQNSPGRYEFGDTNLLQDLVKAKLLIDAPWSTPTILNELREFLGRVLHVYGGSRVSHKLADMLINDSYRKSHKFMALKV